jgi:riboflavin kinase/FMN adenylyltransferase
LLVIDWPQFLEKGLPPVIEESVQTFVKKKSSMTIGVFDGVHRGHQALIKRIVSHNSDYAPVVITFRQNHKTGEEATDIQSFDQKLAAFKNLGVKITVVIDFTESFRRIKGIEFLEILLKHGNIGFFAAGKSFRCGFQLDTDVTAIQEFFASHNVSVEIVDEVTEGSLPISSSRIREAIANGDMELAQSMLL